MITSSGPVSFPDQKKFSRNHLGKVLKLTKISNNEGNGEWEDPVAKLRCTVFFRTIDDWAAKIYQWMADHGMLNDPYTLYEIRCGEDCDMAEFYEMDEVTFNKAIDLLAADGRAKTFTRGGERGVTFYELA